MTPLNECQRCWRAVGLLSMLLSVGLASGQAPAPPVAPPIAFPFQAGDRVAWIGSSSTRIGVWPRTIEYLLRTRHPDLQLTFQSFTTGGGTFATGIQNMDKWLPDFKPTVVLFNYGGNDAGKGESGLPAFKENMAKAVARVQAAGARPLLMTHQAADVRKAGPPNAAKRTLFAEAMIAHAKEKNWPVIDTHQPLAALQKAGQQDDDAYTILKDAIHLTDPAYIAWGYYLYERLQAPAAECRAVLSAKGASGTSVRCKISDVKADAQGVSFTRHDEILPLLPPVALPPRRHVPLEKFSAYLLQVTGLPDGKYEIRCEDKPIGAADAKALAAGVNLSTLLLDSKKPAPWADLAKELWAGKSLEQIGKTKWRFDVRKQ